MENIIKQLKKGAQHARLSVEEKATMRSALVRHMQANPVKNEALKDSRSMSSYGILSPLQFNNLRNKKTMPILVILGLLMSGSASFAAETTVPGDMLYPVKVHVNESVRGAVTVSPAAKAEWEIHLVERRLEEVKKLATRPNAAPQAQQQAQENLVTYTQHVEDRIAKFEDGEDGEGAIKTASDLSNVLAAYEQLLAALATTQTTSSVALGISATTIPATTATSTATTTTTTVATSTTAATPGATLTPANIEALREVLNKLSEVRGGAEEKHKELKKKYHKEDREDNEDGEDDDDEDDMNDHISSNWTPTPTPVVTSTATSTSATSTTTSTITASTTVAIPSVFHSEDSDGEKEDSHREEIRSSSGSANTNINISTSAQATSTVSSTEEHADSRDEEEKHEESRTRERDSHND